MTIDEIKRAFPHCKYDQTTNKVIMNIRKMFFYKVLEASDDGIRINVQSNLKSKIKYPCTCLIKWNEGADGIAGNIRANAIIYASQFDDVITVINEDDVRKMVEPIMKKVIELKNANN